MITTVAELGSVLAQVTPTAAAMNVSFEQVGASLASMTAQGTPTAQATTMLNTMFAELGKQGTIASKNLEKAAQGTEYAGKSFSELMKEGVPLNKVLDVMQQYADKNNLSMIDMFGSIEAGKSALALSGKNSEQFTSNLAAMATQSDVVGDAYEKVTNTLQENTKKILNSVKNVGISIYQDVDSPLAQASKTALGMVQDLSKAFQSGGFEGLVTALGDVLARAVSEIANAAPKFIDAAVNLISSFLTGIGKNANKIADAAVKIGKSLISGLIKIIPQIAQVGVDLIAALASSLLGSDVGRSVGQLGKTIINSFKTIAKAVKSALEGLKPIFSNFVKIVANIAKVVIPPFTKAIELCVKAIKPLAPLLLAAIGAFTALKIISKITALTKAFADMEVVAAAKTAIVNGLIWAKVAATEVLAGNITIVKAAQELWNIAMSNNPIGAVITAIGIFAGVLVGLGTAFGKSDTAAERQRDAISKLGDSYGKSKQIVNEFNQKVDNSTNVLENFDDAILNNGKSTQDLKQQMQDVQTQINTIAKTASDERRDLTNKEISKLMDLFNTMNDLASQELKVHQARQKQILDMSKQDIQSFSGSIEDFKTLMADMEKSAEEESTSTINTAKETRIQRRANVDRMMKDDKSLTQEWRKQQLDAIDQEYNTTVSGAKKIQSDTLDVLIKGYYDRSEGAKNHLADLKIINKNIIDENADFNTKQAELDADYESKQGKGADYVYDIWLDYDNKSKKLLKDHNNNVANIRANGLKDLDDTTVNEIAIIMDYVQKIRKSGGEIDKATQSMVQPILDFYDSLDDGSKETFDKSFGDTANIIKSELGKSKKEIEETTNWMSDRMTVTGGKITKNLQVALVNGIPTVKGSMRDLIAEGFLDTAGKQMLSGVKVIATDGIAGLDSALKDGQQILELNGKDSASKWTTGFQYTIKDGRVYIVSEFQDLGNDIETEASKWPDIGTNTGTTLTTNTANSINNSSGQVTSATQAMLGKQIELIDSNGVKFQTSFEELMKNAETGVKNGGVPVDLAMQDNMSSIISTITNSGVPIEQQTTALAELQTKVFKDNVNNVSDAEKANMQAVLTSIKTTNPDMAKAVEALVNTGVLEIKDGTLEFSKKAKEMGLEGSEAINQTKDDYNKAAIWALSGVESGVEAKKKEAEKMFAKTAMSLATAFKNALHINSPSKVFAKIAQSIPEGIAAGVENNKEEALNAVEQLADETAKKTKREFEQLDLSNSIPDQEVKVTGILEKIKNLNASELVQRIRADVMASQAQAGMAFAARANASNSGVINNITKQPIFNFNQPVESPDTTARAVNRVLTFGLAGDRN